MLRPGQARKHCGRAAFWHLWLWSFHPLRIALSFCYQCLCALWEFIWPDIEIVYVWLCLLWWSLVFIHFSCEDLCSLFCCFLWHRCPLCTSFILLLHFLFTLLTFSQQYHLQHLQECRIFIFGPKCLCLTVFAINYRQTEPARHTCMNHLLSFAKCKLCNVKVENPN